MCARTVYCTNIDKKVFWVYNFTFLMDFNEENIYDLYVCMKQITQADVKLFFESLCGEVCSFFSPDLSESACPTLASLLYAVLFFHPG